MTLKEIRSHILSEIDNLENEGTDIYKLMVLRELYQQIFGKPENEGMI